MFFQRHPALSLLVVPFSSVFASPVVHTSTVALQTYIPLIVVLVSLLFIAVVFLSIKLVYMKYRRIGTIHAPSGIIRSMSACNHLSSSMSSLGFQGKDVHKDRHQGLWVGCLGSPAWETGIISKLDEATRVRRCEQESFVYQLHGARSMIRSTMHSVFAHSETNRSNLDSQLMKLTPALTGCAGDVDQPILPSRRSSSTLRSPTLCGSSSSKTFSSAQQNISSKYRLPGYFDGCHDGRLSGGSVAKVARRPSSSSIRLVDGSTHSRQVEYSFLSGLPPNAVMLSPLMGARDSIQLSRCTLKHRRKPLPPLPPLPSSFLPFYLPEGRSPPATECLPPLHFSPLAIKTYRALDNTVPGGQCPGPDSECFEPMPPILLSDVGSAMSSFVAQETTTTFYPIREPNMSTHKKIQSYEGLAIRSPSSPPILIPDHGTTTVLSHLPLEDMRQHGSKLISTRLLCSLPTNGSAISRKPLKSCFRQNSTMSTPLVSSPELMHIPLITEMGI